MRRLGRDAQTFVSLAPDLSVCRDHLDEIIAGAARPLLKDDRNLAVQIGIEVFAGDQLLTRWQAPNLEADRLLECLSTLGEFSPVVADTTNLNGAVIQGLDRLLQTPKIFDVETEGCVYN